MAKKSENVSLLEDIGGYEFRYLEPMQAESVVEVFFGRGKGAMHDSYSVEGDHLTVMEQGPITDLVATGKMGMIDWNTKAGTGLISLSDMPVFAVTAEANIPILIVGEKKDGKIAVVHRFWKEPVETGK